MYTVVSLGTLLASYYIRFYSQIFLFVCLFLLNLNVSVPVIKLGTIFTQQGLLDN